MAPFENQAANVRAFDWMIAGAPFEIAEKTEEVLGLEPTGGPLHVGGAAIAAEPEPVAAFAAERDAAWVITGWVDRPNWQLRLGVTLWKVTGAGAARTAVVVAETQRTGEVKAYHQLLGESLADAWSKAGVAVDVDRRTRLGRALAGDLYAVNLMGRGLGHFTGAIGAVNLKAAEADLERAVFIDPKCYEAQRLLGELYLATANGDAKLIARATGKFNYANDLAPHDLASARASAAGAARAGKHEVARELLVKLVRRRPWDLDARYQLGAAMWHTGDPGGAERQLVQVTARRPDHLAARRVLVLIHASRGDTSKLVGELEAIAARMPDDLEVKADLATAYGAVGRWDRAVAALEAIAAARPADVALLVRLADAKRRGGDLDGALAVYGRAGKLAPDSSWSGFAAAQALFDAGKLAEAARAYTLLQRHREDLAAAEQALGAIALAQGRPDDAAWYLRRAVKGAPREVIGWRALVAAELERARKAAPERAKDIAAQARKMVDAGLGAWPRDAQLTHLAGVAAALLDDGERARALLVRALELDPGHAPARAALGALATGGPVVAGYVPELARPWGDAAALDAALARYAAAAAALATARAAYQGRVLTMLGALGKGPYAPVKRPPVRVCPVGRIAPAWAAGQQELRRFERLGAELEASYRFIARHDDAGATAGLLPNARTRVAAVRRSYRTALADAAELRAEWTRSLGPELRAVGCSDKLLAAAVADPERYRLIEEDRPPPLPEQKPPRARPRVTFYVDNSRCTDEVDVWIDGVQIGQVGPGRRSALVSDGGERTLCFILPGGPRCGERGTTRQVYLHDGWTSTMHCPE